MAKLAQTLIYKIQLHRRFKKSLSLHIRNRGPPGPLQVGDKVHVWTEDGPKGDRGFGPAGTVCGHDEEMTLVRFGRRYIAVGPRMLKKKLVRDGPELVAPGEIVIGDDPPPPKAVPNKPSMPFLPGPGPGGPPPHPPADGGGDDPPPGGGGPGGGDPPQDPPDDAPNDDLPMDEVFEDSEEIIPDENFLDALEPQYRESRQGVQGLAHEEFPAHKYVENDSEGDEGRLPPSSSSPPAAASSESSSSSSSSSSSGSLVKSPPPSFSSSSGPKVSRIVKSSSVPRSVKPKSRSASPAVRAPSARPFAEVPLVGPPVRVAMPPGAPPVAAANEAKAPVPVAPAPPPAAFVGPEPSAPPKSSPKLAPTPVAPPKLPSYGASTPKRVASSGGF